MNDVFWWMELTEITPHPVGTKARMQANISLTDKSVNATAMAKPTSANNRQKPCIIRNGSWKLADIFWLKVKAWETKYVGHKDSDSRLKIL